MLGVHESEPSPALRALTKDPSLDFGELPSASSGPEPVEGSRAALRALMD
jgi:hypothetical protein